MTATGEIVGTVASLARFPVKSMQGERLETAELTDRGLAGDRAYAVIDIATGKVASAKHPRKWAQLLACDAAFVEPPAAGGTPPPVLITLPDGTAVRTDDADVDDLLSAFLGRRVTLDAVAPEDRSLEEFWPDIDGLAPPEFIERTSTGRERPDEVVSDLPIGLAAPAGTFYDLAPVHLLTTATLERLGDLYPEGRFEPRRYRPNLVVAATGGGFVENAWPGRRLAVGDGGARLAVSIPTMRCVMTTMAQGDLPQDLEVLRTVARHNRVEIAGFGTWACAGAYAGVDAAGTIRVGDTVTLLDG